MRFVYRLTGLYRRFRWVTWLSGSIATFVAPLLGYIPYLAGINARRREMSVDSPEYASDVKAGSIWDWLSGAVSGNFNPVGLIALIGGVFLLLLVVLQIFSFVMARTELSGVDKTERPAEDSHGRESFDPVYGAYGHVDEY